MTATIGDRLLDLVTASGWAYATVAALVALDAVLPLVPGEAVVITAARFIPQATPPAAPVSCSRRGRA